MLRPCAAAFQPAVLNFLIVGLGEALQVDCIKTRAESAWGFSF